jgi:hypothetical protein
MQQTHVGLTVISKQSPGPLRDQSAAPVAGEAEWRRLCRRRRNGPSERANRGHGVGLMIEVKHRRASGASQLPVERLDGQRGRAPWRARDRGAQHRGGEAGR